MTENPTLDNLDATVAQISAPGTNNYNTLRDFVTNLVQTGERAARASPDYFSVVAEQVELGPGPPYQDATVTMCYVDNRFLVDAAGQPVAATEGLVAGRYRQPVVPTPNGSLPASPLEAVWQGIDVTNCPPA